MLPQSASKGKFVQLQTGWIQLCSYFLLFKCFNNFEVYVKSSEKSLNVAAQLDENRLQT